MLKKIILICISLLFITSCIDDREVEKATESREIEKMELELKREKTIKKVAEDFENKYFEKVELKFQEALKENVTFLKISNEECNVKSYYNKGFFHEDYDGRMIDDKKLEKRLMTLAKKYNYKIYDAEKDWTGIPANPINKKGFFEIYKTYTFKKEIVE